jgi:putative intracellular protease/amidase
MLQQELFVPAMHLRTEVRLRRQLRVQCPCASLTPALGGKSLSGAMPHGSGPPFKGILMRTPSLVGSTIALTIALSLALPAAAPAAPAASPVAIVHDGDALSVPAPRAGRHRPLIAIVADNGGAQTTDFIVPYGILKDSGVADVRSVSTAAGAIRLTRGLEIRTDQTMAAFDISEPDGADIVIVPAQAHPNSAALAGWLRSQAARGATIISVCEGARVLAHAGLLEGRRGASHWGSLQAMARSYRTTTWVRDRRYVQDGPIISTAGVTASIPMSLALVEAIGGRAAAEATARRFGVDAWGSAHRTADFAIEESDVAAARLASRAPHETTEIPIADGVDEVSLALQAEAWGRTDRTTVVTTNVGRAPVRSRHGLIILPDAEARPGSHVIAPGSLRAVPQFAATLAEMGRRYGVGVIRLATLGMEYDLTPQSGE